MLKVDGGGLLNAKSKKKVNFYKIDTYKVLELVRRYDFFLS